MLTIKVLPNKPTAVGLRHPHHEQVLTKAGALWPNDSFTARRLVDGAIKRAPQEESVSAQPAAPTPEPTPEPPPAPAAPILAPSTKAPDPAPTAPPPAEKAPDPAPAKPAA